MATGSVVTTNGKYIMLYRNYTENGNLSATQYLAPTQFKVGINNGTPSISSTALDYTIPITDGTVCDDGDNQMTGSNGGTNTTDNASRYKEGAGVADAVAQNLLVNNTSASKTWTIADLASAGNDAVGTKPYGLWLYIADATTLAYFKSSGTALSIRFRTNGDAANRYYEDAYEAADLATGWNFISSWTTNVNGLTQGAGGAPSGVLDEFVIEITTNNATDVWASGDVVYDLLRQWATTDLVKDFVSGYPTLDATNIEATTRCLLTSLQANGFDINGLGIFNEDSSPLMASEDTFTAESKASTDEFAFVIKTRII